MKKLWVLIMISGVLLACSETGSGEKNLDSIRNTVDSVAQKTWDSGNQELRDLKQMIQDSVNRKGSF